MKKDYSHVAVIIDRSGSMQGVWNDVKGGFKTLVEDQKKVAGTCTFTLAVFDSQYDLIEDFTDIQNVRDTLSVAPRGSTALLDAIGKTVVSVGEKLAKLAEEDRPEKVMVVIQTDGYENASREWTAAAIKKLITDQTEQYKWEFLFVGADEAAVTAAQTYGIKGSNATAYLAENTGGTFEKLSSKMGAMRCCSVENYAAASAFSEEERKDLLKDKNEQ